MTTTSEDNTEISRIIKKSALSVVTNSIQSIKRIARIPANINFIRKGNKKNTLFYKFHLCYKNNLQESKHTLILIVSDQYQYCIITIAQKQFEQRSHLNLNEENSKFE